MKKTAIIIIIAIAFGLFFLFKTGTAFSINPYMPFQGGTGTSTKPTYGKVLVGNAQGTYTLTATSSLGISGGSGTNYLTNSGVNTYLNTGTFLQAPAITATSTTATSTISTGGLAVGTSHFVVQQNSGNVGIGTTTPSSRLNIRTNSTSSVSANGGLLIENVDGSGYATANWKNDEGALTQMIMAGSTFNSGIFIARSATLYTDATAGLNLGASYSGGVVRLFTGGSAAANERLRITSTGNIGIGTTSPFSKLSVTGGGTTTGRGLSVANSSNVDTFYVLDNGNAYHSGNVGIGSTSPVVGLAINKIGTLYGLNVGLQVQSGAILTPNNTGIYSMNAAGTNVIPLIASDTSNNAWINAGGVGAIRFGAGGGNEYMRLDTNGNLGIGTTSPGALLHVSGATSQNIFIESTNSSGTGAGMIFKRGSNGTPQQWQIGAGILAGGNDFEFRDSTNGINPFVIKASSGNIGIGTTSPNQKLNITGALNLEPFSATIGAYKGILWNDSTQNQLTYTNGNTLYQGGNLYTATADTTINTTSPTSTLSGTKVGTTVIKANTLKVGQKFTIWGAGYYSTPLANTSTVTITTSIASSTATTISTVTTGAFPASATNLPMDFTLTCTVRAIGASATLVCDGSFNYSTALSAVAKTANTLSTIGTIKFDSTVDETLDIKANWSAVTTQSASVQQAQIDF